MTYIMLVRLSSFMIHDIIHSHNKKNSCPLCKEEGIAKEVRSHDIEIGPRADTIQNADELNGLSTGND